MKKMKGRDTQSLSQRDPEASQRNTPRDEKMKDQKFGQKSHTKNI